MLKDNFYYVIYEWTLHAPNWFRMASLRSNSIKVWLPTFGTRLKNSNSTSDRAVLFSSQGSGIGTSSIRSRSISSWDLGTSASKVLWGLLRSCSKITIYIYIMIYIYSGSVLVTLWVHSYFQAQSTNIKSLWNFKNIICWKYFYDKKFSMGVLYLLPFFTFLMF